MKLSRIIKISPRGQAVLALVLQGAVCAVALMLLFVPRRRAAGPLRPQHCARRSCWPGASVRGSSRVAVCSTRTHLPRRRIPVQRGSRPARSHRQQRPRHHERRVLRIGRPPDADAVVRGSCRAPSRRAARHQPRLRSHRSAALGVGGPRDLGPPDRLGAAGHRAAGGGHLADTDDLDRVGDRVCVALRPRARSRHRGDAVRAQRPSGAGRALPHGIGRPPHFRSPPRDRGHRVVSR